MTDYEKFNLLKRFAKFLLGRGLCVEPLLSEHIYQFLEQDR